MKTNAQLMLKETYLSMLNVILWRQTDKKFYISWWHNITHDTRIWLKKEYK